jgi:hypothetical protein
METSATEMDAIRRRKSKKEKNVGFEVRHLVGRRSSLTIFSLSGLSTTRKASAALSASFTLLSTQSIVFPPHHKLHDHTTNAGTKGTRTASSHWTESWT